MKTGNWPRRSIALRALAIYAFILLSGISHANMPGEYDVKLVYLYNFTKYLTWPDPFPAEDSTSPYTICIMGKLPEDTPLQDLKNKTTKNHPVDIRILTKYSPTSNCHILFLTKSLDRKIVHEITRMTTSGVLVVGETADFAKDSGEIGFVLDEKNRVRLEINLTRVQQKNITIRSQLLEIARKVYRTEDEQE